jgi:hypothetical protein
VSTWTDDEIRHLVAALICAEDQENIIEVIWA